MFREFNPIRERKFTDPSLQRALEVIDFLFPTPKYTYHFQMLIAEPV